LRRPLDPKLAAAIAVVHEIADRVVTASVIACSSASSTNSVRSDAETRQPTMRRAKTSITNTT